MRIAEIIGTARALLVGGAPRSISCSGSPASRRGRAVRRRGRRPDRHSRHARRRRRCVLGSGPPAALEPSRRAIRRSDRGQPHSTGRRRRGDGRRALRQAGRVEAETVGRWKKRCRRRRGDPRRQHATERIRDAVVRAAPRGSRSPAAARAHPPRGRSADTVSVGALTPPRPRSTSAHRTRLIGHEQGARRSRRRDRTRAAGLANRLQRRRSSSSSDQIDQR